MKKLFLGLFLLIFTASAFAGGNYPNFPNNYSGMVTLTGTASTLGSPDNPMSVVSTGASVSFTGGSVNVTITSGAVQLLDQFGTQKATIGSFGISSGALFTFPFGRDIYGGYHQFGMSGFGSVPALNVVTTDSLGNTNGGFYNPYDAVISGYPQTATNLFVNTWSNPLYVSQTSTTSNVISDSLVNTKQAEVFYDRTLSVDPWESCYQYTTSIALPSASGTLALVTPTAGNNVCVRDVYCSVTATGSGEYAYFQDTITASGGSKYVMGFFPVDGFRSILNSTAIHHDMPANYPLCFVWQGFVTGEIVFIHVNYKNQNPNATE